MSQNAEGTTQSPLPVRHAVNDLWPLTRRPYCTSRYPLTNKTPTSRSSGCVWAPCDSDSRVFGRLSGPGSTHRGKIWRHRRSSVEVERTSWDASFQAFRSRAEWAQPLATLSTRPYWLLQTTALSSAYPRNQELSPARSRYPLNHPLLHTSVRKYDVVMPEYDTNCDNSSNRSENNQTLCRKSAVQHSDRHHGFSLRYCAPMDVRALYRMTADSSYVFPCCMQCRVQTRSSDENSVCPSVCHTRVLWQNGRKICPDFYTVQKII